NRSKVLDLGADREFFLAGANSSLPNIRDGAIVRVGEPLGNFYGYVWDGIFQDSVEAAHSGQPGARPGGEKFRDLNGDGVVNSDDRTILGNAQPKYLFGLTGVIGYKSLSLSYIVRGALDFQVVNLNRLGMETPGGSTNMLRSVLDYWTPTNHTNAMTGLGIGPDNARMSSRWIEDGPFVRLQNVTVDWAVPPTLTRRVGARQVRLYVSGQNLCTATRYSWYTGGSNQPYFIRGWPILTEVPSDQTITTQTSGSRYEQDSYTLGPSNEWLWRVWQQIYGAINQANVVIERIPQLTTLPQDVKDRYLGAFKFHRAFNHFNAVRVWGSVPLMMRPTAEFASATEITPAPIAEIYDSIAPDLA